MCLTQFDYEKIYQDFFQASMKAIEQTGDAYKNLSWFGKNKPKQKVVK